MHKNEFPIDETLVDQLIKAQFPKWADLSLKLVPSIGTDNALYRLGSDMLVRLPRINWAVETVDKEFSWLPKIAPFLPLSIPTPLAKGNPSKEYPYPWSIYRWIEGSNPLMGEISESLVQELITFIQALHKIDLPNGPLCNRGIPLQQRDRETREAISKLEGMIDTQTVTTIWEDALKASQWVGPPVWMHGDLSPGNMLVKNGKLIAVIDFGNLGIGDPACDLIIAWNLLPAPMRDVFRDGLGVDKATWERGRGWALSVALIQLPYYKETNPILANHAKKVIEELVQEHHNLPLFRFAHAKPSQKALLHHWFDQPHIKEWMHGVGLQNTLNGLEKFFQGNSETTYWIGYNKDTPFAFLITSPEGGEATTLDAFICDLNYLGKGIAIPMICKFLLDHFPHVKKVLIDPEKENKRAIHVYKKIGFKITHEFIASWHPVPHYQMELDMEELKQHPHSL